MALLLIAATTNPARADCPAAPIADPDDMAISFLAANGVQAASASLLASSVKEGTLIYDNANDVLKVCDGTSWVDVGSGGGSATLAGLTDVSVSGVTSGQVLSWSGTAWVPLTLATAPVMIPAGDGTLVGSMTQNGGLAAAFDGNTAQADAVVSYLNTNTGWVGKEYATAKNVVAWKAWGSTDFGFHNANGNGAGTWALQYKDTACTNDSGWTTADSVSITANNQTIDRAFTSAGSHLCWRIKLASGGTGGHSRVAELQMFLPGSGGGNPASPTDSVQFNNAGVFDGDAALTWDNTAKRLTISGNAAPLDVGPFTNTVLHLSNVDGTSPRLLLDQFGGGNSTAANVSLRAAGGTGASPAGLADEDILGQLTFTGHDGTAYVGARAAIRGTATEAWSPSGTGTDLRLHTTANGTIVAIETMRLSHDGTLSLGSAADAAASSILDLTSTTKGFLPPRMTTAQRNAIASPAAGLMIFNTTDGQFQYYTGTAWAGVGYSVPTGTIAAFASATCPAGWTEYTAARGRFLRGIDNGAGLDPAGTRAAGNQQADALQNITGQMSEYYGGAVVGGGSGAFQSFGSVSGAVGTNAYPNKALGYNFDASRVVRTATETRPVNVAVIFCQYSGSGGGGSGGATTLAGLTDVNITTPSDGQVLKYDNATSKWVNGTASGGSLSGGTSGHLGVWTGATTLGLSSTTAGQQLFWDATNHRLGIGTATPTSALHVNGGNIRNSGLAAPGLVVVPTTGSSYVFGANTAISGAGIYDNTATTWRLVVKDTTGNIGIGLNNPKARLDIYGVGSGATPATSGTDDATMNLRVSRGTVGVDTGMLDSGVGYMQVRNISNLATTYALSLQPTGGNVGIGTVNPQSLLQVAGGIQLGDDAAACPGASDVKVGTLRFNTGNIQLCTTGGWGAISGGGTLSGGTSGYLGVWSGATTMGLSGTSAGQQLFWDGASNRLLLGSVTAYQTDGSVTPRVQVHGTTSTASSLSLTSWLNGANNPGSLILGHSKSATIGTNVLVDSGDALGGIYFNGDGGAGFRRAAYIQANVDATPGTNNMPGRLIFATSAVGSATPTERMRIDSAGNVGIGTTAPDVPLEFAATTGEKIRLWDGGAGSRLGIGLNAANFQFFTGAGGNNFSFNTGGDLQATGTNELMRIQANGNVGVGITTPTEKLFVGGNIGTLRTSSDYNVLTLTNTGGVQLHLNANGNAQGNLRTVTNHPLSFSTNNIERVLIDTAGNVGIGTTSPTSALHVNSAGNTVVNISSSFSNSPTTGLNIDTVGDASVGRVVFQKSATTRGLISYAHNATGAAEAMNFDVSGGAQEVTILGSGNVGIGTTNPTAKFSIKLASSAVGGGLRLDTETAGGYYDFYRAAGGLLAINGSQAGYAGYQFKSNDTDLVTFAPSGNVGIGTTAPEAKLMVAGGNGAPSLTGDPGIINFQSNTTVQLTGGVQNASPFAFWLQTKQSTDSGVSFPIALNPLGGNVGIGTNNPSYLLHVNGTAYATGAAGALSDIRHKKDVHVLNDGAVAIITRLKPVSFQWKDPRDDGMKGKQFGFIAQDVEKVLPEIVLTQNNDEKTKGLKPTELIPFLTKAVQELSAANDNLRSELDELRSEIDALKAAR